MNAHQKAKASLERLASIQGGYFTAAQAKRAGYGYPHQHYHARRGNWAKIDHGLYRLPYFPHVEHEDLIRWTFWSNGKGIVSHESALALRGLGVFLPRKIHLTVPPNFRKKPSSSVTLHRGRVLSHDIDEGEGYRATKPLRSLLDTARYADPSILAQSIRDAIERGLVRPAGLEAAMRKLPRRAARNLRLAWKEAKGEA